MLLQSIGGLDSAFSRHQILFFLLPTPGSGSLPCLLLVSFFSSSLFSLAHFLSAFQQPSILHLLFFAPTTNCKAHRQDTPLHSAAPNLHNRAACGSIRCNGCESCTSLATSFAFPRPARHKVAASQLCGWTALLCFTRRTPIASERDPSRDEHLFSLPSFSVCSVTAAAFISHLFRRSNRLLRSARA